MKHIEVVCAIIQKDGKYFCCQRGFGRALEGKYEFPGGKIEVFETKEEALVREIKEELNSLIKVTKYLCTVQHIYKDEEVKPFKGFYITMHAYLCDLVSGNLTLSEHVDSKWLSINELESVDWAEADKPIIKIVKEGKKNGL